MADNEKIILDKARKGDIEAFEELVNIFRKKIFNIALRMLGNQEDAADITQEVFIRVYRSIKDFKQEAMFSTWIYRIATNVCLDELRKRKNKNTISMDEEKKLDDGELHIQIKDYGLLPQDSAEQNEVRRLVRESITKLPENYRVIIVLRDIQGMSYDEIARILKTPEGTVKSRINRARHALREILSSRKELLDTEYVK